MPSDFHLFIHIKKWHFSDDNEHNNLVPSDFHLFIHIKKWHFSDDKFVEDLLGAQAAEFYEEIIFKLVKCYDKILGL